MKLGFFSDEAMDKVVMMEMRRQNKQLYEFGPFRLDVAERLLTREGEPVQLPPKVFDTLLAMVEHEGHLLEKDDLIKILWPDSVVEEGSLTRNVSYLRKALGEGEAGRQFIETVPRRGYRFVAPVRTAVGSGREAERAAEISLAVPPAPEPLPSPATTASGATGSAARRKRLLLAASAFVMAAVAVIAVYVVRASRSAADVFLTSAKLRLTKLTYTGQSRLPTLSPDGKYLAEVVDDGRRQSLRVRQVETSGGVEIIPSADVNYRGLTFSPDNSFLYYVIYEGGGSVGTLYRIPTLGGVAKRISNDVDSAASLSPDGCQLAFLRNAPARGESALIVANADSGEERSLAIRRNPQTFSLVGAAWSPDGQQIACVARTLCDGVALMDVLAFNIRIGTQTQITTQVRGRRWMTIGQLCWVNNDALLAVAWREPTYTFADQLWLIPARGGEARQVTNDSNSYAGVSASANGLRAVTTQIARASKIYVAPYTQIERSTQIATSFLGNAGINPGLAWTPDGRIVYSSAANGQSDLWMMNADGSARKPLTDDIHTDLQPVVSPDGREVVFVSWRDGTQGLWQMGLNGGGLRLLTKGVGESSHEFSSDGKWIVYDAVEAGTPSLWRMPSGGGVAERLTSFYSWKPVASPDGQWLACYFLESPTSGAKIALVRFGEQPADKPARVLSELPSRDRALIQWTPDSRALIFSRTQDGVSNLWQQPIDGGAARQMTNFTEDKILNFALSHDGRIAYERGRLLGDTVLVSFR